MKKTSLMNLGVLLLLFSVNGFSQCLSNIATVGYQNIVLKPDGSIYSWGFGGSATAQDNGDVNVLEPTQIGLSADWAKIYGGAIGNLFVIKNNQTLWSCGANEDGELGNGTSGYINRVNVLTQVGTATWKMMAPNFTFTLGLKTDGSIWATGQNQSGKLGDGTTIDRSSFVSVGTDNDWREIATIGTTSYGIKQNGTLWSWGYNGTGQLGIDDLGIAESLIPIQVGTETEWNHVYGGTSAYCVLATKNNGALYSFGAFVGGGSIGFGINVFKVAPTQLGTDTDWASASTSVFCSFAIKNNGTLWAWGKNTNGQIGDGTTTDRGFPVQVGSDSNWLKVSASYQHVIAMKTDGSLWVWGDGTQAQLGNGGLVSSLVPIPIAVPGCALTNAAFNSEQNVFKVSPNPAKNSTTITFSNAIIAPLLEVYDVLGKVISSHQASNTNDSWVLDTSKMAAGVYIVALKLEGNVVMQKKLVIE